MRLEETRPKKAAAAVVIATKKGGGCYSCNEEGEGYSDGGDEDD